MLIADDMNRRERLFHSIKRKPVRGGAAAVEQPGLTVHERSGAYRGRQFDLTGPGPNPVDDLFVLYESSRSPAAWNDQQVEPRTAARS